jgi:two-component system sensor histidine kinase SenX3
VTPTVTRFVRLLLGAGLVAIALIALVDSRLVAVIAVIGVVAIAVAQHARLLANEREETVRLIETEDPAIPAALGSVAEAIRQRVETERSASERFAEDLRQSIEAAGIGVLILERDGRVLASIGSTAPVLPTGPIRRVKNPSVLELVGEGIDTGGVVADTFVMGVRSRSFQWVVAPLDDEAVGAVITDVTERDRVQAMRRSFVTDASHELKTPIAAIQAGAGALQMAIGVDDERALHFAGRLEEQAERLGRIVSDLLDLSRLESDEMEPEQVDVGALVRREVEAVASDASERGLRVTDRLPEATLEIEGVAADVALAVRNVLSNALKYTSDGGRITVWAGDRDGRAVVEVGDTGIGIPAADQERIFNRFYRVDAARARSTGGTGLGLAIVRHVVGRHGGTVSVSSVVGQGSTFTLDFGDVLRDA